MDSLAGAGRGVGPNEAIRQRGGRRAEDIQNAAHQESNPIRGRGRGLQVLPALMRHFLTLQQGEGSTDACERAAYVVNDAVHQDLLLLHLLEVKLVAQMRLAGLLQHFLALEKVQPQPLMYDPVAMTVVIEDMPTVWIELKKKGKNGKPVKRRRINYIRLCHIIQKWKLKGAKHVWIEKVNAMPKDGVVQAFAFGESVGAVKASVTCCKLTYYEVTPQAWKKRFDLIGLDKSKSVDVAGNLFGSHHFKLVKDHGKADACLIAAFGADFEHGI